MCHGGVRAGSIDKAGVMLSGVVAVFRHYYPAWFEHAAERDAEARLEAAAKESATTVEGA